MSILNCMKASDMKKAIPPESDKLKEEKEDKKEDSEKK